MLITDEPFDFLLAVTMPRHQVNDLASERPEGASLKFRVRNSVKTTKCIPRVHKTPHSCPKPTVSSTAMVNFVCSASSDL
jgi:hypothetical protein